MYPVPRHRHHRHQKTSPPYAVACAVISTCSILICIFIGILIPLSIFSPPEKLASFLRIGPDGPVDRQNSSKDSHDSPDFEAFDDPPSSFDIELCRALESNLLKRKNVVQFDAGFGAYGRCFMRRKNLILLGDEDIENQFMNDIYSDQNYAKWWHTEPLIRSWMGFESSQEVVSMTGGLVNYFNTTNTTRSPFGRKPAKFHWSLCLSFGKYPNGQHSGHAMALVENLVKHAKAGVVMCWVKMKTYVDFQNKGLSDVMAQRGFLFDEVWSLVLRNASQLEILQRTCSVFVKE